jgi:hypothetical protein
MELAEARHEIKHLLESKTFESSETHRRLLDYLANKSLSGDTDHLKEYTIGIEAFGKPPSYDPQEDSIVRTQISRLRLKLLEYYKLEGKDDPVRVEIPKGSFRLEFHFRDGAAVGLPPNGVASTLTAVAGSTRLPRALPWALCGILAIACIILSYKVFAARDAEKIRTPWPLSRVLNARQQTTIVLADAGLSRLQDFTGRSATLEEYLSSDYPKILSSQELTPRESELFDIFTRWPVVSQAEAETLKTIIGLSGQLESRVYVRSARDLRARDLTDGNAILLGSTSSNPWVTRSLKYLNFKLINDHSKNSNHYFLNQNPKPGESQTYIGLTRTGNDGWAYATVSLVPNERSSGGVLILQGLQREGTVAAGLLLADPEAQAALRRALKAAGEESENAWFEVLIRAESIAAVPGKIKIVAVRVVHPS